jgi:hypothetical protein
MSPNNPLTGKEARTVAPPKGGFAVPAPPRKPLARPMAVQPASRSGRREHEVQRLIRDLAALAAKPRPELS